MSLVRLQDPLQLHNPCVNLFIKVGAEYPLPWMWDEWASAISQVGDYFFAPIPVYGTTIREGARMLLTYKFRLKDGTKRKELKALAGNCNFVWNFSNEVIRRRWRE